MRKARLAAAIVALAIPMLAAAQTQPKVECVPAKQTSATSGKEMFQQYCTPCHGQSGKGDGPAASAMRVPPANLTTLATRNGGQFPEARVAEALRAGPTLSSNTTAHGSETMPVWGPVFRALGGSDSARADLRIHNLVEYVKSIQEK
jgi:mono/diheme cytochrome c family protein